jgi:hypothetical protein
MQIKSPSGFTAAITLEDLETAILAYINEQSSMGFDSVDNVVFFDPAGDKVNLDLEVIEVYLTGGEISE